MGKNIKEWAKKNPSDFIKEIFDSWFKGHEGESIAVLLTTVIGCFLCYFYEMLYGLGCPDLLCEGLHYYRNADYATSQARWMIRYINILAGKNVVIPALTVSLYCMMIGISALILCRMLKIEKVLYVVLLTAVMISFPVISHQFAYIYMALAYSFSFLAVVMGVMFSRKRKVFGFVLAFLCFLMMMGSYQAYIGAASALAIIMLIADVLSEEKIKNAIVNFLLTAFAGLTAAIADIPFSRLMMRIYNTGTENRVSDFSFESIRTNIKFSLEYSYKWFFSYFNSEILSRGRIYPVIFILIGVLLMISIIIKIKKKEFARALICLVASLLIPLSMNLVLILIPAGGMRDIMRYHYVLIFALLFFLHSNIGSKIYNNLTAYVSVLAVCMLLFGNVISANCTTFMYKFTYDYAEKQALLMMEELYDMDGYVPDETPIVMGGAFSYTPVQERYPMIFRYAEQEGGPVFWSNIYGMISCRYHFFMDYMGVDAKYFTNGEYLEVINSDEFENMPKWPEKGSIQMIGDKAVIKIWGGPPQY